MNQIEPPVEVSQISKNYGSVRAVEHVTFDVQAGEIVGLLGENGAGKTTVLEIIEGVRQPTGGNAFAFGEPSGRRSRAVQARIGVQLQATAMLPNLTVGELLTLQASFFPRPLSVVEALAAVGLSGAEKKMSDRLSGGQLQRVALALALVGRPDLLILDEPSAGLDPAARRELWDVLRVQRDAGCAVLMSTHYMEEAEALCDRVAILDGGHLVAVGKIADLSKGASRVGVTFRSEPALGIDQLQKVEAVHSVTRRNGHHTLSTTDATATVINLVAIAERNRVRIQALALRPPSLEELYLELTGHPIKSTQPEEALR